MKTSDMMKVMNCIGDTGVYIFKNMGYWLVGKKHDDLLRKNAIIGGKRWKNREKEEIFNVIWGKMSILEEWGRGQKYQLF